MNIVRKDITTALGLVGVMTMAVILFLLTTSSPSASKSGVKRPLSKEQLSSQVVGPGPTPAHPKASAAPKAEKKAAAQPAQPVQPVEAQRSICAGAGSVAASLGLTEAQGANAATVIAVGRERGLPERAVVIALATAMQESHLKNINYGDRDSLGLFQQRPSQGWGTPKQVTDARYSAGKFYDRLVEVPRWDQRPLTVAAQKVQRSAFPDRYAQWEKLATGLAKGLVGATPPGTSCG